MAEHCLRTGLNAETAWAGKTVEADGFKFEVDAARIDRVQAYINSVWRDSDSPRVEVKLDTSNVLGVPGQGGTGDAVILDEAKGQIIVKDLKDGVGIVFAWRDPGEGKPRWMGANPQLMEYGAAALDQFSILADWLSVRLDIEQPRIDHFDSAVFSVKEVRAWVEHFAPMERLAHKLWLSGTDEEIRANLHPDPKACQWCPVKGSCSARGEAVLAEFPITPEANMLQVTDEQLAAILDRADDIENYFKAARATALQRALAGAKLPGWKAAQGREGNRKWGDDAAAEKLIAERLGDKPTLHDECFTKPKLESPTELEKVLKKKAPDTWKDLQQHITRSAPGYSLVRDYDKRIAQAPNAVEFGLTTESTPASEGLI